MVRTRYRIHASGTPVSRTTNIPVTPTRLPRTSRTQDLTNITPTILFPEINAIDDTAHYTNDDAVYIQTGLSTFTRFTRTPPNTNKNKNTNNENDGPYIGLKQLAHILGLHANKICALSYESSIKALQQYELARLIDPSNDYVNNEAITYEEMGRYDTAEQLYLEAIKYSDDILSMYNLADLYESGKCGNEKKYHAIRYYEMGADHNDPACITKSLLYWSKQDSSCFNVLKLGIYYVKLTQQEHGRSGFRYDTSEHNELMDFMNSHPTLLIIKRLEKVYECPLDELSKKAKKCLDVLCKSQSYLSYKNKMELFTRLNNVTQCPICYEEKINIDISCGHTFCGDCYARIYDSVCPLCRVPCSLNINSNIV